MTLVMPIECVEACMVKTLMREFGAPTVCILAFVAALATNVPVATQSRATSSFCQHQAVCLFLYFALEVARAHLPGFPVGSWKHGLALAECMYFQCVGA